MSLTTAVTTGGPSTGVVLTGAVQAAYSQEILHAAQPILRFAQFCEVKEELTKQPGDTISFLRYGDLSGDPTLTEGTSLTTDVLNSSLVSIVVGERGKAISVSERLLETSFDNVMATGSRKLGEHYARALDGEVRNALRGASTKIRVNSRALRANFVVGDNFNMDIVRSGAETLATNKAPKFEGDYYICFVHPHQATSIRRDSDWIKVTQYGDPSRAYRGEIGRIEDVRFIETTNISVVKNGAFGTPGQVNADGAAAIPAATAETDYHATLDVYQAILFGANAVGYASALGIEIRDNGVEDFGRKHSLAWYGIYGVARIEDGFTAVLESL